MHPNLTAVAPVSNVDQGVGVLLVDLRHSYGQVHALNGMTLEHNLAAAGSNGTLLEALIRPADQALRIGMRGDQDPPRVRVAQRGGEGIE